MFTREFNRKIILSGINLFAPPKNIKSDDLSLIFFSLINKLVVVEVLEEKKIEQTFHIGDKIKEIEYILIEKLKFKFSQVLSQTSTKTEIIVSFLALLELIKQRTVVVAQEELFSEIEICKIVNEINL
jgi:segregation and condensation protein A